MEDRRDRVAAFYETVRAHFGAGLLIAAPIGGDYGDASRRLQRPVVVAMVAVRVVQVAVD